MYQYFKYEHVVHQLDKCMWSQLKCVDNHNISFCLIENLTNSVLSVLKEIFVVKKLIDMVHLKICKLNMV